MPWMATTSNFGIAPCARVHPQADSRFVLSLRELSSVNLEQTRVSLNRYRRRRPGPEGALEDAFLADLGGVLDHSKRWWLAGSLPLGAGFPDFVAVRYGDELEDIDSLNAESVEVLAYLRAVGQARLETIADRLRYSENAAESAVASLTEAGALQSGVGPLALTPHWRAVLSEVVAIEFKVTDWRRALSQASRNLLFAHRSFVALPSELARRVCRSPEFSIHGVGIISVPEDSPARIVRRARKNSPRSWRYYYELASHVATSEACIAV